MTIKNKFKNPNFSVKKLLTTASAFALIATAASDAAATRYTTKAGGINVRLINDQPFADDTVQKLVGDVAQNTEEGDLWSNVDSFIFEHDAVSLVLGGNIAEPEEPVNFVGASVALLDLNGHLYDKDSEEKIEIRVVHDSSIGSIVDSDEGMPLADIVVEDNKTLIVDGKIGVDINGLNITSGYYNGVSEIILGSGGRGESTLRIDVSANLHCFIDTEEDSLPGKIIVNAEASFYENVGVNQPIGEIIISNNLTNDKEVTFYGQLVANQVTVQGGSVITKSANLMENTKLSLSGEAQMQMENAVGDDVQIEEGVEITVSENSRFLVMSNLSVEGSEITVNQEGSFIASYITGDNAQITLNHKGKIQADNVIIGLVMNNESKAEIVDTANNVKLLNDSDLQVKNIYELLEIADNAKAIVAGDAKNIQLKDRSNLEVKNVTGLLEIADNAKAIVTGNAVKTVMTSSDAVVEFIGAANENIGEVVADIDGHGNVTVNAVGRNFSRLGEQGKKLKQVDFNRARSSVTNGIYAQEVNLMKFTRIGDVIDVDDFTIRGDNLLVILDSTKVNSHIKTQTNAEGSMIFKGSARIDQNLGSASGRLKEVKMSPVGIGGVMPVDPKITLAADIYAEDVVVKDNTLKFTNDAKISGKTEIENVKLDFGSHHLTHDGNVKIRGNNEIDFDVHGKIRAMKGGNLVINGDLEFAPGSKMILRPTNKGVIDALGSHEFAVISAHNIKYNDAVIEVRSGPFQEWRAETSGKAVKFVSKDVTFDYLKKNSKGSHENTQKIANATSGKVLVYKGILNEVAEAEYNGTVKAGMLQEVRDRVEKASTTAVSAHAVAATHTSAAENVVGLRASSVRMPVVETSSVGTRTTASAGYTGVAAGDDAISYGAWVNPFYSTVAQKERGEVSGYNSYSYGASVGCDAKISENSTIGVAFSLSNSHTKHKDSKNGDKTKVSSLMFSVYNVQELTDNWFMIGTATAAKNRVHNYSKRIASASGAYETAQAAYSMMSLSAKGMFGYSYKTDAVIFTPMFGVRASRVNAVKYDETGATQNLSVSTKAANKLEVIAGMSVIGAGYNVNSIVVTPEFHAFANCDLFNRTQRSLAKLGDTDFSSTNKVARMSYNLGVGLKSEYNAFEYGASYDLQLADKRVGHQGAFKVRVNF
jgi:hypothetical protein